MKPFTDFINEDESFWAYIKYISERLGYSDRKTKKLRRYSIDEITTLLKNTNLELDHLYSEKDKKPHKILLKIVDYLNKRSEVIEKDIFPNLMDREEAMNEFEKIRLSYSPKCNLPLNKQKKEKRHYAYLTCIVNMLTEKTLEDCSFEDNPRGLTIVEKEGKIIKTFSRWMDGAYPCKLNPIAVWEIKEYYGTTTFGSRVADGVYETMLDGKEIKEVYEKNGVKIKHYLILDDRYTWWACGKSYLCRVVDLLNMGLVDEVLFGRQVISEWPKIVKSWRR